MKVAIFYDYYSPAYKAGGPIRSIENLVGAFKGIDSVRFFIFTGNKDIDGTTLDVESDTWQVLGSNVEAIYLSNGRRSYFSVTAILSELGVDVVYANGMFSIFATLIPLFYSRFHKIKIVLAPRGMLHEGALGQKPIKKRVYLYCLFRALIFPNKNLTFHATDKMEEINVRIWSKKEVFVAGNVPSFDRLPVGFEKKYLSDTIRFTTISLITPKKNHEWFLSQLQYLQVSNDIIYDVYGPTETDYFKHISTLSQNLPPNIKVNFLGPLTPGSVSQRLSEYHFFVLPTKGENFGHALFEALNVGVPLIISDQTPWKGLVDKNAGWDMELNAQKWKEVLRQIVQMNAEEYQKLQVGARSLAEEYYYSQEFTASYLKLFSGR